MNINDNQFYKTNVTIRITALWAFSEAFMGGILHGLKVPFAGLALAFVASVCITLIALGNHKKGEILKATLLVIAVKFMLSPHTPFTAYIAVLVQGFFAECIFFNRKAFKPAAFILTIFSLLYSAFQHLVVLTVIFGKNFWQAIDIFLNKISQSFVKDSLQYSLYFVIFYLGCYLIAGIAGGILNIKIVNSVQANNKIDGLLLQINVLSSTPQDAFTNTIKARKKIYIFIIFGTLMFALLIFSYLPFFNNSLYNSKLLALIIRAIIIILVWNFFVTTLLRMYLQKWFVKYKEKNSTHLQQIIILLPGIKNILQQSWQISQEKKKWLRFKIFMHTSVLLIVYYEK
jgi:hypothetical protein